MYHKENYMKYLFFIVIFTTNTLSADFDEEKFLNFLSKYRNNYSEHYERVALNNPQLKPISIIKYLKLISNNIPNFEVDLVEDPFLVGYWNACSSILFALEHGGTILYDNPIPPWELKD